MAETVGRYVLHESIARGGMATVHAARLTGAEGFHRLVAAKRLHPEFTEDPEFVTMFHDEAKIASRIHHPNVVPVLDVVVTESEVVLVQEYVHGVPLSLLMRRARQSLRPIPIPISVAVAVGILLGLHAAHEAKDDLGTPLDVIHRDVSPQNVMLSTEGVPRLLDFGIAKARTSTHQTRPGVVKGKLSYMAPEQIRVDPLTRRVDVYATGIVLWELLSNRRIMDGQDESEFLSMLFESAVPSLVEECSAWRRGMGQAGWKRLIALDAVVMKAISLRSEDRYATAQEMADAIVAAHPPATQGEVAAWVAETAEDHLARMRRSLAESEEEFRAASRIEAETLSRRGLRVAPEDVDADRATLPNPEARGAAELAADTLPRPGRDGPDGPEAEAMSSSPPTALSNFERTTEPEVAARRPRLLPWVATGAAIFVASFLAARHPDPNAPAAPATDSATAAAPPLSASFIELSAGPASAAASAPIFVEVPIVSIPRRRRSRARRRRSRRRSSAPPLAPGGRRRPPSHPRRWRRHDRSRIPRLPRCSCRPPAARPRRRRDTIP